MAPSWDEHSTKGRSPIPELPEVETVRRELAPWLAGRTVLDATLEAAETGPKYRALDRLAGQDITEVTRRGKFLILPLERAGERLDDLVIHLGMTGVISATPPERPQHLRVRLQLSPGGTAPVILGQPQTAADSLYFTDIRRFGRFLVTPAGDYRELPTLHAMGPEPLGDGFTVAGFAAALARSSTALKTYLLSQKPVAGLGNIYVDEALWRSGLAPLLPSDAVPAERVPVLHGAIRDVLAESIEAEGTTLSDYRTVKGSGGAFQERLQAYGRAGEACLRCGSTMERIVIGGRSTHYCPTCQVQ